MKSQKQPVSSCPNCKKSLIWNAENPYRPFCSERCKQIDLGNWANEGYRIPVEENNAQNDSDYDNE